MGFETLLDLLKNTSLSVQKAIVPILGNNIALSPEIITVMLNYLGGEDDEFAIAAAKGMRFKENLPAFDIIKMLEWHRKRDPALGKQLDNILLSSLVSEDAALPHVFAAFVHNFFNTEPNSRLDTIIRINEIRIWYWRLSNNRRGGTSYPHGFSDGGASLEYKNNFQYERNDRNQRAKLAMNSVPGNIQNLFIAFLRQMPDIAAPTENNYEDRLSRDLRNLEIIRNALITSRSLLLSEAKFNI